MTDPTTGSTDGPDVSKGMPGVDINTLVERLRDFDDECDDGFRMSECDDRRAWDDGAHNCDGFDVFRLRLEAADALERLHGQIEALKAGAPVIRCCKHCEACAAERELEGPDE